MKKTLLLLTWLIVSTCLCHAQSFQKMLQTQMIMAEDGDTIYLEAGTHPISQTLSMDEKKRVVLKGAGEGKTILSFEKQEAGAEGLRITNSSHITMMDMTIQDAKGDCIKAMDVDGFICKNVTVEWTGKPNKKNGAYGFYPVNCSNVLIDNCTAIGASDAGIYVGQSHNVIVRNSTAHHNVAGIEIENTTMADVHDCYAYENTGGILVFDLPDLPKKKGGNVRVFNNKVENNNYKNFAPKGNIVGKVPPGSGIMILATNQVEVFKNDIIGHKTVGVSIISYFITEEEIKDEAYYPYPSEIYVHDNRFEKEKRLPSLSSRIGKLLFLKYGRKVPDILYDGIVDEERAGEDYKVLCIRNNQNARFTNLDAANDFNNISYDLAPYDCSTESLKAPELAVSP
ncbi:MAG: parallel beta-helix domain-containing protein [Bacteroidota bacterium]